MNVVLIYFVSFVLALLPLIMALFFLFFILPRKILELRIDLAKLRTTSDNTGYNLFSSSGPSVEPESVPTEVEGGARFPGTPEPPTDGGDVERLVRGYLRTWTLVVPSLILVLLYLSGFLLCDARLLFIYYSHRGQLLFSAEFLTACVPVLYAFLGVYVFNLGAMTRRVYLADMNEQVFWGAMNRLILSVALAVVLMRFGGNVQKEMPTVYFAIGFMANIVLQWVLEKALKLMNIDRPKRDDLPLQMIKGINLWKEHRLEEEGIESVQNLATANILELAAKTHYNARTLIDWIDQAIVLSLFTIDQVKTLNRQAFAISAIGLATCSPQYCGNSKVSDQLAAVLKVDETLMANTLDSLFEDRYVRELWSAWQSGRESLAKFAQTGAAPM